MRFTSLKRALLIMITLAMPLAITVPASASTPSSLKPCVVKNSHSKPKTVTTKQVLHPQTVNQNDASLASGTTKQVQAGKNGTRTIYYKATYKKGKLTACKHTATKVTAQPVNAVVAVGTYVAPAPAPAPAPSVTPDCTNGTYVNSSGNTVCSPEASSSAPAGATAQCVDGTYSFSLHRSGTCSYHGGVSTWL